MQTKVPPVDDDHAYLITRSIPDDLRFRERFGTTKAIGDSCDGGYGGCVFADYAGSAGLVSYGRNLCPAASKGMRLIV